MSKYLLFILFIIFFMNSCSFPNDMEKKIIKIKNSDLFRKKSNTIRLNFDSAVENIIVEMLNSNNICISKNKLFFIDTLENNTDLLIDTEKLTNSIKNKLSKKDKNIHFLQKKIIVRNKKKLGILNIKNTLDNSTAILLSRNNNVKYYLHGCIFSKNNLFLLKIKLILVETGEIIFMKKENFYW